MQIDITEIRSAAKLTGGVLASCLLASVAQAAFVVTGGVDQANGPPYYQSYTANSPLTRFGPENYSYNIGDIRLDQRVRASLPGQIPQGGSFSAFANYSNTYELMGIDLFDANDNAINNWTLTDLATGQTVFNQDGRVAVPEPATLAF
jgi:hypothetical protein